MNGRRYRLDSAPAGTHSASVRTSRSIASTNDSAGNSGRAIRRALRSNRAPFASGRNAQIEPSSCR